MTFYNISATATPLRSASASVIELHRNWLLILAVALVILGCAMLGISYSVFERLRMTGSAQIGWTSVSLTIAGGAICTVALAAAREWQTPGFRNESEVQALLGLPVVAVTPNINSLAKVHGALSRRETADALIRENAVFAESIQTLLTRLMAHYAHPGRCVIAICSALPSEGKTTFTMCLAQAAARLGLKVVLVDCDGRREMLSEAMQSTSAAGLVQVLRDNIGIEQALAIDPTSGAAILRHSSDGRSQNLHDPRMISKMFAAIGDRFDVILLDTGPLLALAEAAALARAADTVLLISHWRKTPRNATLIAARLLQRANASLAGVILTRVDRRN